MAQARPSQKKRRAVVVVAAIVCAPSQLVVCHACKPRRCRCRCSHASSLPMCSRLCGLSIRMRVVRCACVALLAGGGGRAELRSLTSRDLAALSGAPPDTLLEMTRRRLTGAEALPPAVAAAVDARIEVREAAAEISVSLTCPECGCEWRDVLDVAGHLWAEIAAAARRLMGEIAEIAATGALS